MPVAERTLTGHEAAAATRLPSAARDPLARAFDVYRRRTDRCRTVNQLNRVHIALGNYATPAELRHFAAALAATEPPDSPRRQFVADLVRRMPRGLPRPREFERRGALPGLSLYSAGTGAPAQKTLIIGFAGHFGRLMLPTPWILDCLDPDLYDVVVLRDLSRREFVAGVPGVGGDFFAVLGRLPAFADPAAYRRTVAIGTSAGGLSALLAAICMRLARGISISGQDFTSMLARVRELGFDAAPYALTLAARPAPFPTLVLMFPGDCPKDADAALAMHALVPSQLARVNNCPIHGVLGWIHDHGKLPEVLAGLIGQSLERTPAPAVDHTRAP
jgi:hypothetical protein